jgi:hypothetical protein
MKNLAPSIGMCVGIGEQRPALHLLGEVFQKGSVRLVLFYSDGAPGPATDLVRVNVEGSGSTREAWFDASADRWTVRDGWKPYPHAQLDMMWKGELFMVDASQVPDIQQQMRADYARYV